jgi:hypothetical protein
MEIQNKVYSMRYRDTKKRNTVCCAVLILYKDKKATIAMKPSNISSARVAGMII